MSWNISKPELLKQDIELAKEAARQLATKLLNIQLTATEIDQSSNADHAELNYKLLKAEKKLSEVTERYQQLKLVYEELISKVSRIMEEASPAKRVKVEPAPQASTSAGIKVDSPSTAGWDSDGTEED